MNTRIIRWSLLVAAVAGTGVVALAARTPVRPAAGAGTSFDPFTKTTIAVDGSSSVVLTGVSRRLVEPPFRPQPKSLYRRPPGAGPPFTPPGPPPFTPPAP